MSAFSPHASFSSLGATAEERGAKKPRTRGMHFILVTFVCLPAKLSATLFPLCGAAAPTMKQAKDDDKSAKKKKTKDKDK